MLRAIILTQYRRVTDGQTDGIAIASTAPAMRALRHTVKTATVYSQKQQPLHQSAVCTR